MNICGSQLPNEVLLFAAQKCLDVYKNDANYTVDVFLDHLIIAIRGTCSIDDWMVNIKFLFRREDVHRGFKHNAVNILKNLCNNIYLTSEVKIVLTGHSLGGATATVLADIFRENNVNVVSLVTFGSPKPGGRGLRKRIKNIQHLRFVHGDDIVSASPPWLCGYVHTHPKIPLMEIHDTFMDGVQDHEMQSYYDSLKTLDKQF